MPWSRPTGNTLSAGSTSASNPMQPTVTPGAIGRLIIVSAVQETTGATFTISDTGGHTWATMNAADSIAGAGTAQSWWTRATTAAAITITVTPSQVAGGLFGGVLIDVFDGEIASGDPVSAASSATFPSGSITSSITPLHDDCLLWGCAFDTITAVGAGFTKGADDAAGDWTEYKALTGQSGASQTVNFTGSGAAVLLKAALRPVAGGGGSDLSVSSIGEPVVGGSSF